MMKSSYLALLWIPIVLLSSCVESEEEIWIHANGSGKLKISQEMPALALSEVGDPQAYVDVIHEIDALEDSVSIQHLTYEMEGSKLVFRLEASFENILKLEEIGTRHTTRFLTATGADPEKMATASGETTVKLDGLQPSFQRVIDIGSLIPAPVKKMPILLGNASSSFTMHFPSKVKETNAHQISNGGKTIHWNFLLKNHLEEPMVMNATSSLPIPWWAWALLLMMIVVIIFASRWLWKRFFAK